MFETSSNSRAHQLKTINTVEVWQQLYPTLGGNYALHTLRERRLLPSFLSSNSNTKLYRRLTQLLGADIEFCGKFEILVGILFVHIFE